MVTRHRVRRRLVRPALAVALFGVVLAGVWIQQDGVAPDDSGDAVGSARAVRPATELSRVPEVPSTREDVAPETPRTPRPALRVIVVDDAGRPVPGATVGAFPLRDPLKPMAAPPAHWHDPERGLARLATTDPDGVAEFVHLVDARACQYCARADGLVTDYEAKPGIPDVGGKLVVSAESMRRDYLSATLISGKVPLVPGRTVETRCRMTMGATIMGTVGIRDLDHGLVDLNLRHRGLITTQATVPVDASGAFAIHDVVSQDGIFAAFIGYRGQDVFLHKWQPVTVGPGEASELAMPAWSEQTCRIQVRLGVTQSDREKMSGALVDVLVAGGNPRGRFNIRLPVGQACDVHGLAPLDILSAKLHRSPTVDHAAYKASIATRSVPTNGTGLIEVLPW